MRFALLSSRALRRHVVCTRQRRLRPGHQRKDSVASGGKFPLAAKARPGQWRGESRSCRRAANQGAFDMTKWKSHGPAYRGALRHKVIWNPAKIKLMQGGKLTGGTVFYAKDGQTYCAMANAGYDFIWTRDAALRT